MKKELMLALIILILTVSTITFAGFASGKDEGDYTILEASIAIDPEGSYVAFCNEVTSKVDSYVTAWLFWAVNEMVDEHIFVGEKSVGQPTALVRRIIDERDIGEPIQIAESHNYGCYGIDTPYTQYDTYVELWCVP